MKKTKQLTKADIRLIPFEEVKEKYYGKRGTPKREAYEAAFEEELIGEIIKQAREGQKYTQEELADLLQINKSNISKIENNQSSIRMETFFKILKALKIKATIKLDVPKVH